MEQIPIQSPGQDATQLVTEEKRLLLSRLLARLAHEVRNPLSSLDIHVQLLQEDLARAEPQTWDKTRGRLETIRGELHRLEDIVESFLRLAGPSPPELMPVGIAHILEHVCDLLRPEASARQIQIELRIEQDVPPLLADAGQLTQALLNLALNALQAVERQGRIEIHARRDTGDFLTIEVCDSGPGVPSENQAAIFDPYFTTKEDGTGLGLWIARQIAVAHGGAIKVANGPAGGAIFSLLLPLVKNQATHG